MLNINNSDAHTASRFILQKLDIAERRVTIPMLAMVFLSLVQSVMIRHGEYFRATVILDF